MSRLGRGRIDPRNYPTAAVALKVCVRRLHRGPHVRRALRRGGVSNPPLRRAAICGTAAGIRAAVRSALETHLRLEPEKSSRSRIKRLRGLRRPQYRLRVGEISVFYDVSGTTVEVLAIVPKSEAESWLAQFGSPE